MMLLSLMLLDIGLRLVLKTLYLFYTFTILCQYKNIHVPMYWTEFVQSNPLAFLPKVTTFQSIIQGLASILKKRLHQKLQCRYLFNQI